MNRNAIYLAVFAALCVLAGVFAGAGIAKRQAPPTGPGGFDRSDFRERAERRIMGYAGGPLQGPGPGQPRPGEGPEEVLITKLELNREQAEKVMPILERTKRQIDDIGKDVQNAIAQIKDRAEKEIMDILTPQQQEKFKALRKEFERRGPGPMMGGPG